ncbi:MAG: hypothetical protein M0O93_06370 [Bacteroidales bacterium]|nr:hypothetical protein [Bacteroidales bacterium]
MKNKLSLFLILSVLLSITFIQCQKKEEKKLKTTKYEVKENYVISSVYTISGYHIKDTINNIYGALLVPISKLEDNNIDIKPITSNIGIQMQEFVDKVKQRKSEGENFIEIRPAYFVFHDNEIYSCLIKKTICLANEDTTKTYNTIIFNYIKNKLLGFDDIFNVNESNYSQFVQLFDKNISSLELKSLKQVDFNIETDSISFNIQGNNTINRYKQSIENLRPYFNNNKQFTKE